MTINKKLAKARQDAGLSQTKLANLLGVSKQYINNVESGRRNPSDEQAINWVDLCGFELIIHKEVRQKLLPPEKEDWYLVKALGNTEFVKMYWLDDFGKFVDELKNSYDSEEGFNTWEIEEWKESDE